MHLNNVSSMSVMTTNIVFHVIWRYFAGKWAVKPAEFYRCRQQGGKVNFGHLHILPKLQWYKTGWKSTKYPFKFFMHNVKKCAIMDWCKWRTKVCIRALLLHVISFYRCQCTYAIDMAWYNHSKWLLWKRIFDACMHRDSHHAFCMDPWIGEDYSWIELIL